MYILVYLGHGRVIFSKSQETSRTKNFTYFFQILVLFHVHQICKAKKCSGSTGGAPWNFVPLNTNKTLKQEENLSLKSQSMAVFAYWSENSLNQWKKSQITYRSFAYYFLIKKCLDSCFRFRFFEAKEY